MLELSQSHNTSPNSPLPLGDPSLNYFLLDDKNKNITITIKSETTTSSTSLHIKLKINGPYCAACTNTIKNAIKDILQEPDCTPPVNESCYLTGFVTKKSNENIEDLFIKIKNQIEETGFEADENYEILNETTNFEEKIEPPSPFAGILKSVPSLTVGIALHAAMLLNIYMPMMEKNSPWDYGTSGTTLLLMLLSGHAFFKRFLFTLLNISRAIFNSDKKFPYLDMDTLITINCWGAWIWSTAALVAYSLDKPFTQDVYFSDPLMTLGAINLSSYVKNKIQYKLSQKKANVASLFKEAQPQHAYLVDDKNTEVRTHYLEIQPQQILLVKPGERVPVDAELLDSAGGSLDQSIITGEELPQRLNPGEKVYAGSINRSTHTLNIRAICRGGESEINNILRQYSMAKNKSQVMRLKLILDKISNYFVLSLILIAATTGTVWYFLDAPIEILFENVLNVLFGSCPCTLGLAVPLSIAIAGNLALENKIFINDENALWDTRNIKTIVFDKTGTLTTPSVKSITVLDGKEDPKTILRLTGALEAKFLENKDHPLANAIKNKAAKDLGLDSINSAKISEIDTSSNAGLSGIVDGVEVHIGNAAYIETKLPTTFRAESKKSGVLAVVGKSVAHIEIEETLRDEAKDTITYLKERGITCVMLTGDNEKSAKTFADKLNIKYAANQTPTSKKEYLEQLVEANGDRSQGLIAVVGDNTNDALAAQAAHISMAINSRVNLAKGASIVLYNSLTDIIKIIQISKETASNISQNLFIALVYNISVIALGAFILPFLEIRMTPMYAGIAMAGSSLLVVANAARLNSKTNFLPAKFSVFNNEYKREHHSLSINSSPSSTPSPAGDSEM